jgi:AcrR family transcriptional regulator
MRISREEAEIVKADTSVKARILDAALEIVEELGIEALSQPRVAKAAGVRQSHLTYYFPRKADLFVALLQAAHERKPRDEGSESDRETLDELFIALEALMFDRRRMRFFLGIVLEASEEPELRPLLAAHADALTERVARGFGRPAEDPAVTGFVDALRGAGLRMLLQPETALPEKDVERIAARFGLHR